MKILFLVNELLTVCGVSKHFYYLLKGLKEYYPDNDYFVITGGGDAIRKFSEIGVPIYINKNIRHESRSYKGYVKAIYDIYRFTNKNKIDIIHSHHHYAASIADKISKIANVKTILTNHGLLPEIGRLNHFSAEHIIAVNEHILEYLIKNKTKTNNKVSLIKLGFPIKNYKKTNSSKLQVIAGGRFVKEKGFDDYIVAVSKLPKEVKNKAEFYLAGEGKEGIKLKEFNSSLGSPVIFLGAIENFQKKLLETDIFVMPSKSKAEGFPTVLIEAGITKNLIIVSDFLGLRNYFNEKYGLIYEQNNLSRLIDLLNESILNFELHKNKIFNFYEFIEGEFDLEGMVRKTNNLYLSILKNG